MPFGRVFMGWKAVGVGGAVIASLAAIFNYGTDLLRFTRWLDDAAKTVPRVVASGGAALELANNSPKLKSLKTALAKFAPNASVRVEDGGRIVVANLPEGTELKAANAILQPESEVRATIGIADDVASIRQFCSVQRCLDPSELQMKINCGSTSMAVTGGSVTYSIGIGVGSIDLGIDAQGAVASVAIPVRDCGSVGLVKWSPAATQSGSVEGDNCSVCGIAYSHISALFGNLRSDADAVLDENGRDRKYQAVTARRAD